MACIAIWTDNAISLGDTLATEYRARLDSEGLGALALVQGEQNETGGAGAGETDRHFAQRFANSAGRSIYVCIDPLVALGDVSRLVNECLVDGNLLLVDVPSGSGAGSLGLLAAIYEQRRAGVLPTLPLRVTIVAGDFSQRGREHFRALAGQMRPHLTKQGIELELHDLHWDAADIRSSSAFIDRACQIAVDKDRAFLLVSNFSDALADENLRASFEHFLSQFGGRMCLIPNSMCWIEPNSKSANRMLPRFGGWFEKFLSWFVAPKSGVAANTTYQMRDPITSVVYGTGVSVLKADHSGMPW